MGAISGHLRAIYTVLFILAAITAAWVLSPISGADWLFISIFWVFGGGLLSKLKSRDAINTGPAIRWEEMYASERLAYFMWPIAYGMLGIVMFIGGTASGGEWIYLLSSLGPIVIAILLASLLWYQRHGGERDGS